jgi:hypothetical protein
MTTPGSFRLLDHLGNIIAQGGTAAQALAPLPDSVERNRLLAELRQMKADAAEAEATQARARDASIRTLNDSITRLTRRLDALEIRHADKRRRDAEAKRQAEEKAIADRLARMPDADDPASYGEDPLTIHGPSAPEDEEQLRAITSGDADNQGDLPEQLLKDVPADPGKFAYEHPPRQIAQPVSVSLNEA